LQCEHHTFRVTENASDDLPALARALGEPFADSSALATFYLARETRKHVTVALSGDGGDELFGGYDRYSAMRFATQMLAPFAPLGRFMSRGHGKSFLTRAGRFLASSGLPAAMRYDAYVRLFDDATLAALGLSETDVAPRVSDIFSSFSSRGNVAAALATDRVTYLPGDLLTKVDRCSMQHALEVRSPFMDHHLVRRVAGLNAHELLRGGKKRLLREAFCAHLPAEVFTRRKMGFAVPVGEWFRGSLRSMLVDSLTRDNGFCATHFHMPTVRQMLDEHLASRRDHTHRLYALLMLELWRA